MKRPAGCIVLSALTAICLSCSIAEKSSQTTASGAAQDAAGPIKGAVTIMRSDYARGDIQRLCREALDKAVKRLDGIANIPPASRSTGNTLLAFEDTTAVLSDEINALSFMAYVLQDEKIREEASACEEEAGKTAVTIFTRKDLYSAIKDAKAGSQDEKRLLDETVKRFEKNGLKLPDDKLDLVRKKMKKLATLESRFSANLNNDTSSLEFTPAETEGAPDAFLTRLKKTPDGSKYIVTTKSPDFKQFMDNVRSSKARKRMQLAYFNRAAANIPILEDAFTLRRETAELLGFKNWLDYRTFDRMAKTGTTVLDFLGGIRSKLSARNKKDLAALLEFKKQHFKNEPENEPGKLNMWDINYLSYQLKKRDFDLDDSKIREFFPTEKVMAGIFEIYSLLLGVRFEQVKDASQWAGGVKLYRTIDKKSGKALSHFFVDAYPRPGKYGHFAAFSLVMGRKLPGSGYNMPVSSIVGNFNPPSGDKPSLLNHDEVETLFHEFGHIMHQTLTKAPYSSLAGSDVARDFVETPSQMFEEWAWQPALLKQLSSHYRTGAKLSDAMIKRLLQARDFNQGYFYTRQLYLSLLDASYHTSPMTPDILATNDSLYKEIIGLDSIEGGKMPASFGHLMGYDGGYYSYLWAEVYAVDCASRFQKEGFTNPATGMRFRRTLLERGNMADGDKILAAFLGRAPSQNAFLKKLGIR